MNRRAFLGVLLAAPAIVRPEALMRILPMETWVSGMPPALTPLSMMVSCFGASETFGKAIYVPAQMEMSEIDEFYRGEKTLCPPITLHGSATRPKVYASGVIALCEQGTYFTAPGNVVAWRKL